MSDSASDRNVEDVLSSVRRLVSNELPRMPRPTPQKPAAALVLTESQRISGASPSKSPKSGSLEDRIAELEAAVGARADEYEPDGSEDQEVHRPRRIVYTRPPTDAEKSGTRQPLRLSQIALIETGPANDESPASEEPTAPGMTFRHGRIDDDADSAPSRPHEDATAQAEVSDDNEYDDDPMDALVADVSDTVGEIASEALAEDDGFKQALAAAVEDSIHADDGAADSEESSEPDTVSTFDEYSDGDDADGEIDVETSPKEPDSEPEDVALNDPLDEMDDLAEESASPDPIAAPVMALPVAHESAGENSRDVSIDLEDLRPLVASLIREELQGELGERITRNVRKLVRREIHRALSSRDLE